MKLTAEWTRQRRKISELEDNKKLPKANKKKIDKRKERKKEGRKEKRKRKNRKEGSKEGKNNRIKSASKSLLWKKLCVKNK